jgi:YD repeat-containing protein
MQCDFFFYFFIVLFLMNGVFAHAQEERLDAEGHLHLITYDVLECYEKVMHYAYNSEGQLVEIIAPDKTRLRYHYDSSGRLSGLTLPDHSQIIYHYDGDLLTSVERLAPNQQSWWWSLVNAFQSCFQFAESHTDSSDSDEMDVQAMMKAFLGETTYVLMGLQKEETQVAVYGEQELNDKVRLTFMNGILITYQDMLENLQLVSESHGNTKIHYVFRPTRGWSDDIVQAGIVKFGLNFGFRSTHAYLLAQTWRQLIQEMGGVDGGGIIVHYAHSLGGSDTDRARKFLSPEEQKMIRVITFGSATLVSREGFSQVVNILGANEWIYFLDPLGCIRNYFDPNHNLVFHGSFSPYSLWCDHYLTGKTYRSAIDELGQRFLVEFAPCP